MAEQEPEKVSQEELIKTNMIQIKAITRLLVSKNLLSMKEILVEVSNVNWEEDEKAKNTE